MTDSVPDLRVAHIRGTQTEVEPRLLRPQRHLIHVAFNNRVEAGEKWIGGRAVPKHAGRVVARSMVLPAGSELRGWTTGSFDFLRIELAPAALAAAAEAAGRPGTAAPRPRVQLDDPVLWHAACLLRADLASGSPGGKLLRDGLQAVLAWHLASGLGDGRHQPMRAGSLSLGQLRAVEEHVRTHLDGEIRLADLAGVAGLSTFHFARAFKAATGRSPYQHVLDQRLATACRLLEGTDLPTSAVGGMVGFQTSTGFGVAFRRRWGVSPRDYRASVRG